MLEMSFHNSIFQSSNVKFYFVAVPLLHLDNLHMPHQYNPQELQLDFYKPHKLDKV